MSDKGQLENAKLVEGFQRTFIITKIMSNKKY